jgi:regulator of protease activity HflC (stomatin/prohibitin superfamily)
MKQFFLGVGRWIQASARWIAATMARLGRFTARTFLGVVRSRPVRFTGRALLSSTRIALFVGVFTGLVLGAGWLFLVRVPPGTFGVKQANFGGGGLAAQDFGPGLHFGVRGLTEWHFVDSTTKVLAFAWESEGAPHPMLELRTKDGNVAQLGISVPYRVKRGEAHLLVAEGLKHAWNQRVKSTVEKVLLQEFANLSSADLAVTDTRIERCALTLPKLNALLSAFHVEAESILITGVMFGQEYEKKLQQVQLTRQTALLSNAQMEVEKQRVVNNKNTDEIDASEKAIRAEMDLAIAEQYAVGRRKIVEIDLEARDYDRRRRSEAQAEYDRLVAEGERGLLRAEQVKEELANEVYDSAGGRLLLARQAAENLNIRQVTLNSNDPRVPSVLDLDELVSILVGKPAAKKP